MKRKIKFLIAAVAVTGIIAAGAAVFAAGGDANDPLVTLSYLTNIFTPQVESKVDAAVANREAGLKAEVNSTIADWENKLAQKEQAEANSSTFTVVTLSKGQTLVGEVGCEIMLRVGSATCVANEAPGLIDCTGGSSINDGVPLVKNHLYMVTIATRGVKATADTVKVMVRGPYTIVVG